MSRVGWLVVCESREPRDRFVDKISEKNVQKVHAILARNFRAEKAQLSPRNFKCFGCGRDNLGGGRVELQNWLANDRCGAYISMPHPLFGAREVCYIEKQVLAK